MHATFFVVYIFAVAFLYVGMFHGDTDKYLSIKIPHDDYSFYTFAFKLAFLNINGVRLLWPVYIPEMEFVGTGYIYDFEVTSELS